MADKERTIQDILDEMTPEQKDLQATIVGAAIEDVDLSDNPEIVNAWLALPEEQKHLIDFLVGNILEEDKNLNHSELEQIDNFLAHFGVKGMKWGVRNVDRPAGTRLSKSRLNNPHDRAAAKAKVAAGKGSLQDAHVAALKSTGHRAINAFTGDKRFWRNMAITAGVTGAVIGATAAAPALLPAGILVGLGTGATNAIGAAFGISGLAAGVSTAELAATGAGVITGIGMQIAGNVATIGTIANVATNTGRAVRGNARVDRSYSELGRNLMNRQTQGAKATRKILNQSGSINKSKLEKPKPALKQSDLQVGQFLSHYADTPVKRAEKDL